LFGDEENRRETETPYFTIDEKVPTARGRGATKNGDDVKKSESKKRIQHGDDFERTGYGLHEKS